MDGEMIAVDSPDVLQGEIVVPCREILADGTDIAPCIESGGFKWSLNDIDSQNAGRTMDGTMHRGRVTQKVRLDITCRPLTSQEARTVLSAITQEYVQMTYIDPLYGPITKTFYNSSRVANIQQIYRGGQILWTGISFALIER